MELEQVMPNANVPPRLIANSSSGNHMSPDAAAAAAMYRLFIKYLVTSLILILCALLQASKFFFQPFISQLFFE